MVDVGDASFEGRQVPNEGVVNPSGSKASEKMVIPSGTEVRTEMVRDKGGDLSGIRDQSSFFSGRF